MTLTEATAIATELAQMYRLPAYVHTDPCLGFNFRFMGRIEDVLPGTDAKTVYVALPVPSSTAKEKT